MDTEQTIRTIIAAYDAGQLDRVAELMSDQLCYKINARPESGPYVADCHDKDASLKAIGAIRDDWNIDSFKLADLIVAGNRGAAQIDVTASSRHMDHTVNSNLALFFSVENGLVTHLIEYHDTKAVSTARSGWT